MDVGDRCPRCKQRPLEEDLLNPDVICCSCGWWEFKIKRMVTEMDVGRNV